MMGSKLSCSMVVLGLCLQKVGVLYKAVTHLILLNISSSPNS